MSRVTRVLAVDDDPMILEVLSGFLALQGYEVVTAQNAGDAFMLLEVSPPDVVLLDITMPGVDGVSALRRFRAIHPALPIIMLTASVDADVGRDALKRGAFDYVAKPVDFPHLLRVIAAALDHRA